MVEFSAPPMVFSSDGCYVELKVDRKETGLKSCIYRVTAKGTHDTSPEVLTRVIREALTKSLGSSPSALPYAEYSGRIEFTWDGATTVDRDALLTGISEAISAAKIRNPRSKVGVPSTPAPPKRTGPNPCEAAGFYTTFSAYDGRMKWRCNRCPGTFDSEDEVRRHQLSWS